MIIFEYLIDGDNNHRELFTESLKIELQTLSMIILFFQVIPKLFLI